MTSLKLLALACVMAAALADDTYTDKYDNINLQEILDNKRLLMNYVNCVLEKGKCNAEGKELKDHLEEALQTGCAKCTEAQKKGAQTVIEHLIKNELELWRELANKYDPQGTFRKKYEDQAKEHGIVIPDEMNSLLLFVCLTMAGLAASEQYTDRYDNLNVEEILSIRRLLVPYIKCMLEQGRCTPEGKELKLHVKDGMQTGCSKCTPWQRTNARKVVKHIREKETEYWEALKKKYDPKDEFKPTYEAFLAADD
ncbi:unnamed protein product [Plutella xylostella]|nr:unnamed protein product [Plutella xylostella]